MCGCHPNSRRVSNQSLDEENNAEVDLLIHDFHDVRNRVFWQVGRFLVHSPTCLGTFSDEVTLHLGKRVFSEEARGVQAFVVFFWLQHVLTGCSGTLLLSYALLSRRLICTPHQLRFPNTSTYSLQGMLRLAE